MVILLLLKATSQVVHRDMSLSLFSVRYYIVIGRLQVVADGSSEGRNANTRRTRSVTVLCERSKSFTGLNVYRKRLNVVSNKTLT